MLSTTLRRVLATVWRAVIVISVFIAEQLLLNKHSSVLNKQLCTLACLLDTLGSETDEGDKESCHTSLSHASAEIRLQ